ncbi:dihydrofolate reductase family protein [Nocardia sp. NPDC051463]|uniref:dihydrofolate reductase family protein n=1 Tax=Nocardia sp. NPDC051463 TaxID=3154845 RepID=UPI003450182A
MADDKDGRNPRHGAVAHTVRHPRRRLSGARRPQEDPSGGFTHGRWSAPYGDEDFGAFMTEVFDEVDAFLLGRRTHETFASYRPESDRPDGSHCHRAEFAPKYVVSTHLDSAGWGPVEVLRGDLVKEVTSLEERPGRELQVHGSGNPAQSLLAADLIDTMHLLTFRYCSAPASGCSPTMYGPPDSSTSVRTTASGVVIATYRNAGAPKYGSLDK